MGFLNQIFGKREKEKEDREEIRKEEVTKEVQIKEEVASEVTEKAEKQEVKKETYTLVVEQIFSVKQKGCLAVGVVRGGKITVGDEIFLLGRGKQILASQVAGLDNPQTGEIKEAPVGMPVAVLLEDILPEQVFVGDVITNETPNTEDIQKPITNPRIKGLMRQAAGAPTEEMMNLVYEEFAMNARFISVILLSEEPITNEDGTATFKEGATMQLPLLTAPDGSRFYPAFTDKEEMAKWQDMKEPKTVLLSLHDYVALVMKNEDTKGIVVNPFSENMMMDKKILEHLRKKKELLVTGMTKESISDKTPMTLSDFTEFPVELAKAMEEVMKEESCVEQAWLRLMKKDGEISYLLVIDVSLPGNLEMIFNRIAEAARPHLHGMLVNIISYKSDFGRKATEGVPSFYQK